MKRWCLLLAALLLLTAGAALAAEGEYYQGSSIPPDEALAATFDNKDLKFVKSLGRFLEAPDKYTLYYISRYQERQPTVASLTLYKLASNLWVYQFGQATYVV
ncbi:MAG: hypothetical protein HY794_14420, partial [Desulfarculus sp.]|nr:hypothetical protein [Desulfarculus sp.]